MGDEDGREPVRAAAKGERGIFVGFAVVGGDGGVEAEGYVDEVSGLSVVVWGS